MSSAGAPRPGLGRRQKKTRPRRAGARNGQARLTSVDCPSNSSRGRRFRRTFGQPSRWLRNSRASPLGAARSSPRDSGQVGFREPAVPGSSLAPSSARLTVCRRKNRPADRHERHDPRPMANCARDSWDSRTLGEPARRLTSPVASAGGTSTTVTARGVAPVEEETRERADETGKPSSRACPSAAPIPRGR